MSALAPFAPQLVTSEPRVFTMKEKKLSLTGDSAYVKDHQGNTVFRIKANLISMSARRVLKDASGKELAQARRKKTPGLHPTYYLGTMSDEKKVHLREKGILNPLNSNATIIIDGNEVGKVKGNWRAKSFTVTINDSEVMTVSRKTNMTSLILDADSYCLNVGAGMDPVFAALIVVGLDELHHDDN
eukprot:CAMPEP_0183295118 /NCGR_PEP_ID=MMETSP0160_2-20130417/3196_1 /TAXON_ID=2839 ORGANISM="Odontella Sinensis, Strain Grunow 1884" /NCGR_SAMPLE_ID=MMETSP0160_2 /ASSEMBLY_ACC=CAM_ASM_000250 /LENGTH=185 /DNA_ID=CAMNT_0025456545 /DNA_START=120 /DNA_END=677 /DNA_ORIENTATION=+